MYGTNTKSSIIKHFSKTTNNKTPLDLQVSSLKDGLSNFPNSLWVFACNVPGACLFGNDRGECVRDLSKGRRKRGNGHSSIRGWRKSKWGACFQQLVSSLRCRARWLHCPQFMRRRRVHARVHTPVRSCQSRQRPPPNSTQFTGTVSFSFSI